MTDNVLSPDVSPLRVLATSDRFEPGFRGGGPIRSIATIIDTITDKVDLRLITRDRDLRSYNPYPELSGRWIRRGRSRVFYLDTRRVGQWLHLRRELSATQFDLLYVNSLWSPLFTVIPIVAMRLGLIHVRKLLIAPRGELGPGALSLKNHKKRMFWRWWGPFLNSMNPLWQASSDDEASQIRAVIPDASVEVSLDPVSLPYEPIAPTSDSGACARLVFIGRIAPIKNLDLILRSLGRLSKPVEFDIYGPVEDVAYWSKCQAYIRQVPAWVQIRYHGELAPSDVCRTFANYDAFIFPTLGENFGHVIAESLSASCPVVCSDRTPWTRILEVGGGAVVRDLTTGGLAKELERRAAMTPGERSHARLAAGRQYRYWRTRADKVNILDQVLLTEWLSRQ
jgi:glycosyltransferase involved in cell wall biosynthesis